MPNETDQVQTSEGGDQKWLELQEWKQQTADKRLQSIRGRFVHKLLQRAESATNEKDHTQRGAQSIRNWLLQDATEFRCRADELSLTLGQVDGVNWGKADQITHDALRLSSRITAILSTGTDPQQDEPLGAISARDLWCENDTACKRRVESFKQSGDVSKEEYLQRFARCAYLFEQAAHSATTVSFTDDADYPSVTTSQA